MEKLVILCLSLCLLSLDLVPAAAESCLNCRRRTTNDCNNSCGRMDSVDSIACNRRCVKSTCLSECGHERLNPFSSVIVGLNQSGSPECDRCLQGKRGECETQCEVMPQGVAGVSNCQRQCLAERCKTLCAANTNENSPFETDTNPGAGGFSDHFSGR